MMKILDMLLNLILGSIVIFIVFFCIQLFCFASFKIPTDSMEPLLKSGDCVLVNKMCYGARIFNVFAALEREPVDIYRTPGWEDIKRNDIVVFNCPHSSGWDRISLDMMTYYVKRCIALPGDTLHIDNYIYKIKGIDMELGNLKAQKDMAFSNQEHIPDIILKAFPFDSLLNWSIRNWGPMYIPKTGSTIKLKKQNILLYKKIIEWETGRTLEMKGDSCLMGNKYVSEYRFKKNYYFFAGDKVDNSQDSRYWGLLPEEYIVGKAWLIWKSVDIYTGEFRWNRFLKRIN